MKFVIVAGGTLEKSPLVVEALQKTKHIIAADSGAKHVVELGFVPRVVIGDMDSLSKHLKQKLEKLEVKFVTYPPEKDETDTELALSYALRNGATAVTFLGASAGNRFDHVVANLQLSFTTKVPLTFINGNQIARVVKGPDHFVLTGKKNDLVSLIPIHGNVKGITTKNLLYPLTNETLILGRSRGVSNVFLGEKVKVSFKKGLLAIIQTILM